ncbi:hypothetical protein AX16_010461 [Volvariella volvacea WC 439]|nr:hypothetical protein AX16_010461 [Volvariella volvacea WC 439]
MSGMHGDIMLRAISQDNVDEVREEILRHILESEVDKSLAEYMEQWVARIFRAGQDATEVDPSSISIEVYLLRDLVERLQRDEAVAIFFCDVIDDWAKEWFKWTFVGVFMWHAMHDDKTGGQDIDKRIISNTSFVADLFSHGLIEPSTMAAMITNLCDMEQFAESAICLNILLQRGRVKDSIPFPRELWEWCFRVFGDTGSHDPAHLLANVKPDIIREVNYLLAHTNCDASDIDLYQLPNLKLFT